MGQHLRLGPGSGLRILDIVLLLSILADSFPNPVDRRE